MINSILKLPAKAPAPTGPPKIDDGRIPGVWLEVVLVTSGPGSTPTVTVCMKIKKFFFIKFKNTCNLI